MKNYVVYFDVFGKKLKTTVKANNEEDAKKEVLLKIKFDKVVEASWDAVQQAMKDINDIISK